MDEYQLIVEKINEEIDRFTGPVLDGSCETMDEYCVIVGRIAGLRWAKNEIKELRKRRIREDDA